MGKRALPCKKVGSRKNADAVAIEVLHQGIQEWLADCEYRQHSPATIAFRRMVCEKLSWFLVQGEYSECGTFELRAFLNYLTNGHKDKGGRWGNPQLTKPVKAVTVKDYHRHLRTLFTWMETEYFIDDSPLNGLKAPKVSTEQIQPFSREQVESLLVAARSSRQPLRNEAILTLLFDTGLRASELCGLNIQDVDMSSHSARVLRKGNKTQIIYFGRQTARVLRKYLRGRDEGAVFLSEDGGITSGSRLTTTGLRLMFRRLGKAANITSVRCSPHTLRHTFAVEFLRNGGNVFSLKQMLSHNSLHVTMRYVNLAEADIQFQHRQFSPADKLNSHR